MCCFSVSSSAAFYLLIPFVVFVVVVVCLIDNSIWTGLWMANTCFSLPLCAYTCTCIVTRPCDIFLEVCVFFVLPQVHAALGNPTGNRFSPSNRTLHFLRSIRARFWPTWNTTGTHDHLNFGDRNWPQKTEGGFLLQHCFLSWFFLVLIINLSVLIIGETVWLSDRPSLGNILWLVGGSLRWSAKPFS